MAKRPRIYLIVNEIPEHPELNNAFITSSVQERDKYMTMNMGPDHVVTMYELDNIDMHRFWIQAFDEI